MNNTLKNSNNKGLKILLAGVVLVELALLALWPKCQINKEPDRVCQSRTINGVVEDCFPFTGDTKMVCHSKLFPRLQLYEETILSGGMTPEMMEAY